MAQHYYTAVIGSHEFSWFTNTGDDKTARRKVVKWINMFWNHAQRANEGSLAHTINNTDPVGIQIGRIYCEQNGVVPFKRYAVIDDIQWDGKDPVRFERGMIICGP